MSAKAPDFKPGDMMPGTKYRIVRQIGAGGMGVVYQVVKPPEIQGVLKLMSSDLTEHEEFRTRFLDEVRVLAQIDHPNIVKVFDYDKLPDGTPFYVMEVLHGRTVRDVLATMGTFPPRVAFEITRQLCEALHCAHTHDIPVIHRDIKPENIFLHAPRHGEPVVKLIDFGVVALGDRQHDGQFVGTWKYAAPEQIRGERPTPATDLYAVGLVLYEMLCGIGPFEHLDDSGSLVSQAHLKEIPPPVSKFAPWVPPSIVELIASALAKNPRQRPRDAYAFAERLYELEWANDGKDPNDQTSEGPLSRILSTVGNAKPSSKNMPAAPPRDRLGNVPVLGVPPEVRIGGPTMKGIGGLTAEPTSPGEDALLAGLLGKPDQRPRSKKERESGPSVGEEQVVIRPGSGAMVEIGATPRMPDVVARSLQTMDAPPSARGEATSDSFSDGTTKKLAAAVPGATTLDDTFASQESDARHVPRRGRLALPIALGLFMLIGAGSFAAYRSRTSGHAGTTQAPPEATGAVVADTHAVPPPTTPPSATPAPITTAVTAAIPTAVAPPATGKNGRPGAKIAAPAQAVVPPAATTITTPPPEPKKPPTPAPSSSGDYIRGL